MRALEGELDDNDIGGGVDKPECAMHVGKRDPVIADRFGHVAAAVGHAHGIVGEFPRGREQVDPPFEIFALRHRVGVTDGSHVVNGHGNQSFPTR